MPPALRTLGAPLLVAVVVFLVFLPVLGNDFVDWDDGTLFVQNLAYRGLGPAQIRWMFSTVLLGHYVPLTWLTLGLDYVLWGMNPVGYHLTNLLLHTTSAVLLLFIARRLLAAANDFSATSLGIGSVVAALFFAIHPLRVESVAWVTERRGVLSGALFLGSVLLYLKGTDACGPRRRWYVTFSVVAYLLAALAKSSVMTLPVVLVLLDVYPLGRLQGGMREWLSGANRSIWAEKAPFVAVGLLTALLGYGAHAEGSPHIDASGLSRATNVVYSLTFHLMKTAIPAPLSPRYEAPLSLDPLEPRFLAAIFCVVGVTILVLVSTARSPLGITLWVAYGTLLAPASGVIPLASQLTADRYSYLPGLVWAVLVGAGSAAVAEAGRRGAIRPPLKWLAAAAMAFWLVTLGMLTWRQEGVWRDSESLWRHAVLATPDCSLCHVHRGQWLQAHGDLELAVWHYQQALALRPSRAAVHANLAWTLTKLGRLPEAAEHYRTLLIHEPTLVAARSSLAAVLIADGRPSEALDVLRQASDGNSPEDVIAFFSGALVARPDDASLRLGLLQAYLTSGRVDLAREQYEVLRRLDPSLSVSVGALLPIVTSK
jgi:tetratricopeptide (TPR) repeat protein